MSNYKSYSRYKDSGLNWLGSIPEHWELLKGKWEWKKENRPIRTNDDIVTAFRDGEVTLRKNRRTDGFTMANLEHGYQGIRKGDLVIHGMDAFAGAIGVSDSDGKSTPVYSACTQKRSSNPYYFAYMLKKMSGTGWIEALAKGIRERSTEFKYPQFSVLEYPVPPKQEQTIIANFLDKKTAEIKEFIALKEKAIKVLKEKAYKLSINGFETPPNQVREWEDNFPKNWDTNKGKWIFKEIKVKNMPEEELLAVTQNRGVLPKAMCEENFVSPDEKGLLSQKLVFKESFVISLRSFQGGIEFSYFQGIVSPAYTVFVINDALNNEKLRIFYKYFLKSKPFIELLNTIISGIRDGQNISFTDFSTLNIPIPDEKTQCAIFDLDKIILKQEIIAKKEITLIKEYQQSLISDAVTGKIDVREI